MMNDKVKLILSILLGVIVSVLSVMLIESIGHAIYPPPHDLDFSNQSQLMNYIDRLPLGAFFIVLLSWIVGLFLGSSIACYFSRKKCLLCHAVISGFILLAAVANLIIIPHPMWFSLVTLLLLPATAFFSLKCSRYLFGCH